MEKLDKHFAAGRISESTHKGLEKGARIKKRKKNEFIRICLDVVAEKINSGKWDDAHLY